MTAHPKTKKKKKHADVTPVATPPATMLRESDIPLDNIPDKRRTYSEEFKRKTAARIIEGGEINEQVSRELGIAASVVANWVKSVKAGLPLKSARPHSATAGTKNKGNNASGYIDFASSLRSTMEQAARARDERLEIAASILENDAPGKDTTDMAKRIRALKRTPPPT